MLSRRVTEENLGRDLVQASSRSPTPRTQRRREPRAAVDRDPLGDPPGHGQLPAIRHPVSRGGMAGAAGTEARGPDLDDGSD